MYDDANQIEELKDWLHMRGAIKAGDSFSYSLTSMMGVWFESRLMYAVSEGTGTTIHGFSFALHHRRLLCDLEDIEYLLQLREL